MKHLHHPLAIFDHGTISGAYWGDAMQPSPTVPRYVGDENSDVSIQWHATGWELRGNTDPAPTDTEHVKVRWRFDGDQLCVSTEPRDAREKAFVVERYGKPVDWRLVPQYTRDELA